MNVKVAASILLVVVPLNTFAQSTPVPVQHRRLVNDLLTESLANELRALRAEDTTHYGTRNEYITQMWLHGRVGAFENAKELAAAIMEKHEERSRDRSQQYYQQHNRRYRDLTSTADGLADLIRAGSLEQVLAHLQKVYRARKSKSEKSQAPFEEFWVSCKLSVAYFKRGETKKSRDCLNLARAFREGSRSEGRQFDADDDWLPEMSDRVIGWGGSSADQSRATFLATLVQSGQAELAIKWFLARNGAPRTPDHGVWSHSFAGTRRFVGWVSRYASASRAQEVADRVFGKHVPAEMYAAIISGGLERGEIPAVTAAVDQAVAGLKRPKTQWGNGWNTAIESLAKHKRFALADRLLQAVLARIEQHVKNRQAADTDALARSEWNWALNGHFPRTAAMVNKDAAIKLIQLTSQLPVAAGENPDLFRERQLDVVRVQCGVETELVVPRLAQSMRLPELLDVLLESGQITRARNILNQASDQVRLTTSSGGTIGGSGLAVMGSNPHRRIRLARRAVRLNDLGLARKLIDEIPHAYARRDGYRAITLRIAEHFGQQAAEDWLNDTTDEISRSGGNMGLVEFLVPIPPPTDDIPKPWLRLC